MTLILKSHSSLAIVTDCHSGFRLGAVGAVSSCVFFAFHLGVEPKIGVFYPPKWMVKIMENPMNKWMIWGGFTPLFLVQHPFVGFNFRAMFDFFGALAFVTKIVTMKALPHQKFYCQPWSFLAPEVFSFHPRSLVGHSGMGRGCVASASLLEVLDLKLLLAAHLSIYFVTRACFDHADR